MEVPFTIYDGGDSIIDITDSNISGNTSTDTNGAAISIPGMNTNYLTSVDLENIDWTSTGTNLTYDLTIRGNNNYTFQNGASYSCVSYEGECIDVTEE